MIGLAPGGSLASAMPLACVWPGSPLCWRRPGENPGVGSPAAQRRARVAARWPAVDPCGSWRGRGPVGRNFTCRARALGRAGRDIMHMEEDTFVVLDSGTEDFMSGEELRSKLAALLQTDLGITLPPELAQLTSVEDQARALTESYCDLDLPDGSQIQWFSVRLEA